MELGTWYIILGTALVIIGFGERFILYKFLVSQGTVLPEKAGMIANIASAMTITVGLVVIGLNFIINRH